MDLTGYKLKVYYTSHNSYGIIPHAFIYKNISQSVYFIKGTEIFVCEEIYKSIINTIEIPHVIKSYNIYSFETGDELYTIEKQQDILINIFNEYKDNMNLLLKDVYQRLLNDFLFDIR